MTTPVFTTPPDPAPNRGMLDPAFVAAGNAFLAWIYVFVGQLVTGVAWIAAQVTAMVGYVAAAAGSASAASTSATVAMAAAGYTDISGTALSLTTGAKAITLQKPANSSLFTNGDRITLMRLSDPTARMSGQCSACAMGATPATMTVTISSANDIQGAAPPGSADWLVILSDFAPPAAATAADILAKTDISRFVSANTFAAASAFFTLTDASTVATSGLNGVNFQIVLGGNRLMGAPTNMTDGWVYTWDIYQDATGSRVPSWASIFDFGIAGTPTLSTGANKKDKVFAQYCAATGKLDASFRKAA